jgi:hypothetical protein
MDAQTARSAHFLQRARGAAKKKGGAKAAFLLTVEPS